MSTWHMRCDLRFTARNKADAYRKLSTYFFNQAVDLGGFSEVKANPPPPEMEGSIEVREDLCLEAERG